MKGRDGKKKTDTLPQHDSGPTVNTGLLGLHVSPRSVWLELQISATPLTDMALAL